MWRPIRAWAWACAYQVYPRDAASARQGHAQLRATGLPQQSPPAGGERRVGPLRALQPAKLSRVLSSASVDL